MRFADALRITFVAGSSRKVPPGEPDHVEEVGWGYGLVGPVVLVIVQAGLLYWSAADLPPGASLLDLALVSAAALVVPFALFAIVAAVVGRTARLPAAFLYMGLVLAALQLVSAIVSSFGAGSSGFLMGILGAVTFVAARSFLKLGWPAAIGIAVLVVIGFIAAGLLIFLLPSGKLLM